MDFMESGQRISKIGLTNAVFLRTMNRENG